MGEAGIFSEEEAGKVFAVIKVCSVALRKGTFFHVLKKLHRVTF